MFLPLLMVLAAAPAPQSWTFETDGAPEIQISNVEGEILVDGVDGNSLVITVSQDGSEAQRRDSPVEVVREGNVVKARVCCGPCAQKRRSCEDVARTHFRVKAPRGAELNLSSVNAEVKVEGVAGEQEISTVDGRVELRGSQRAVSVSAVSGDVILVPGLVQETSVSTVSGSVKFRMPKGTDAHLKFSSVGGSFNGQSVALGGVERKYGKGTHEVEVSTVSGQLEVQKDKD